MTGPIDEDRTTVRQQPRTVRPASPKCRRKPLSLPSII